MLHDMWHTTPEETSMGCVRDESDFNYSPEFRFVLLHLRGGREPRERLVEIHRADEAQKTGL